MTLRVLMPPEPQGPAMVLGPEKVVEWRKAENRERLLRRHGARDAKEPI